MKKTGKTLKSILSFALAAAMSASLVVMPAHATDKAIVNNPSASGWGNTAKETTPTTNEYNSYVTDNETTGGFDINVKAGVNSWWTGGAGAAPIPIGSRYGKFKVGTYVFDFKVEIPDDETFALANNYFVMATKHNGYGDVGGQNENVTIKVVAKKDNDKYGLYVYHHYDNGGDQWYPVATADSFAEFKGWHNVKFAMDTQKYLMAVYNEDGTVTYSHPLNEGHPDLIFVNDHSFIGYMAVMLNNKADEANDKKVSYKDFYVKTLDRTLDATFTREGDVVKATFTEPISQSALNKATYTIAQSGSVVSGATVTATKTGNNTAELTVSGITAGTEFALTINNLFAESGRTSDGAIEYAAAGQKVYNDTIIVDGNEASTWKNAKGSVTSEEKNGAYATNNETTGGVDVNVKAGINAGWGWSDNSALVPNHGVLRSKNLNGSTKLFEFDVEIPDDETFALNSKYLVLSILHKKPDGDNQNENANVSIILRKNGDKYQLCADFFDGANAYYTLAEADTFDEIKGWKHVKFAYDTQKFTFTAYDGNGLVGMEKDLNKQVNPDFVLYEDSYINYAAVFPNNKADTTNAKKISYKNFYVKSLERGLEATFERSGDVVKATFSEPISQATLDNATYTIAQGGEVVAGATVTATKTDKNTADLTVSGIASGSAFALTMDNVFANSGRTSDGAMQYAAAGQKVYNDTVIVGNATSSNWGNVDKNSTSADTDNAYVTNNSAGGFDVNIKAETTVGWANGAKAAPVLNGSTYKKFLNAGKTLTFDFDVEIPNNEDFATKTTYLALRRKSPEYDITKVLLKKNATTGKYELYVDNWFDNGRNGKYVIATADTFAGMVGWHHVKFSMDTQKSLLAVYAEDGTVNYSTPINVGNNDLIWTDDVELRAIVIYPGGNNTTDQKISYKNFNIKQLERGFEATATTKVKSTSFVTTVEFDEDVNIADVQNFVTVERKDGQKDTVTPQIAVTADGTNKAVITVTKLFANTDYVLKVDGLFNNNGRTSNDALVKEEVKTTKSDSVYVDGTVAVNATAEGFNTSVTYKNASDTAQSFWTAVALYKENGELVAIVPMDVQNLASGESVTKTFESTADCSSAVKAKVFVWDSIDNMVALQKHELINLK